MHGLFVSPDIVNHGIEYVGYIDGLMQERRNSIANALELRLSCINPSIRVIVFHNLM